VRSPNAEILAAGPGNAAPHTSEALLLVFGMLGVAIGAFQWTVSPWFVAARQAAAEWLVGHDLLWPLESGAPWWLLTHYPEANDVFTWLDGGLILAYIGAVALTVGGAVLAGLTFAARIGRIDWRALALSLIPLAGVGLFLGLSMMTATHLRAEGAPLGWLPLARGSCWQWASHGRVGSARACSSAMRRTRRAQCWPCPSWSRRWPLWRRPGYWCSTYGETVARAAPR
jgi:hypothetical protein